MLKKEDIRIRDPFIYADKESGFYYMYGTTAFGQKKNTFSVYKTRDLENFEEPKIIFDGSAQDFWGDRDYWAAELHRYGEKYYLFASFKAEGKCRGTHILVCDTPDGEFRPVSDKPATPPDWECLDGTLYIEDGIPYMVFCHEWVQIGDGTVCAQQLSQDLTTPVGEPIHLFRATDNKDVSHIKAGEQCFVTDGPFFYYENGKPVMIWSSFSDGRYVVLEAESDNGRLDGNWLHRGSRFPFDGGHAMIFHTFDGKRMISLHAPNRGPLERPVFFEY